MCPQPRWPGQGEKGGYVISVIGQDSYFKGGKEDTVWDAPEAVGRWCVGDGQGP